MINVLLVDDHELIRTGIRRLLDDVSGITVYAEAESGEEALKKVRSRLPDVVLMDVSMPGIGGLEATRKLRQFSPELPIIILTVHTDDPFPSSLLKAGASGYLHKGCKVDEIVDAIREEPDMSRMRPRHARRVRLTWLRNRAIILVLYGSLIYGVLPLQREMQVMLMLVQGEKVQDISGKLHLSPKTISTYRYRLFDKLGVRNDADLTRLAIRHGVLNDA